MIVWDVGFDCGVNHHKSTRVANARKPLQTRWASLYFERVSEVLVLLVLTDFCGLKLTNRIIQLADHERNELSFCPITVLMQIQMREMTEKFHADSI